MKVVSFEANPFSKRLYDDLLSNYNRLIRPVVNNTETLTVWLGLKLSQLIEVNLKNQVMTTNLWVKQKWFDYKLRWEPEEYGGVEMLYVPSEHIWVPDIVLYNNWDGNYEVTLMTKATLKYTGEVFWEPPAIYKSSCEMNVEYFPYDEQICFMKFGSWTYNGAQVDLKHLDQVPGSNLVQIGIDLSEFYLSVEWDILEVPATKNEEYYPDTSEPFSDITFKLTMRRKTLFYTVNLIIPCVALTFLTVLVFYLPSDSGEKVTLCISILVSLTVFFLLLAEIIPPTSLAVPLLGKYLLFTMMLVSLSVWTTVCVLNIHFRSPSTHNMSPAVKKLFLRIMPKLMMMRRTQYTLPDYDDSTPSNGYTNEIDVRDSISDFPSEFKDSQDINYDTMGSGLPHSIDSDNVIPRNLTPEVLQALRAVRFIAQHIKDADKDNEGWTWPKMGSLLFAALFIALHFATGGLGNPDAKRLYDDLLSNYNRLIRPVGNNSDRLTVKMGLRLSQLIDVNLKNQIMTTNVWVEQEWNDYKLKWNPDDYGGVDTLHVPSEHIWLPDIVLYNNADGNYEVTIMTKAILHHTGKVVWKPPAIYKSFCEIDVEYFPFDEQTCFMKFGSWTYDGYMVDLRHLKQTADSDNIEVGIDLQDYYISVEWDIMRVPAVRNEKFYSCCEEPYLDIVFNLTLRRKTLFYTVNLIIPCVGISFLSVLVFYLPSDSGEKISLCISILLSLTVFFLLLAEIIPPTSLTVPLLGKYLLFTMMLVTLSVVVTIAVLNVNFRSPVTHKMAPWVQRLFIQILPKVLCIERPKKDEPNDDEQQPEVLTDVFHLPPDVEKFVNYDTKRFSGDYGIPAIPTHRFEIAPSGIIGPCFGDPPLPSALPLPGGDDDLFSPSGNGDISPGCCAADISPTFDKPYAREMEKTIEGSRFIAQHVRNKDKFESVEEDWKYVAMVLDRLFLWIFTIACILGTALIILQAPSLYDHSQPIDILYSKIAKKKFELLKMGSEDV